MVLVVHYFHVLKIANGNMLAVSLKSKRKSKSAHVVEKKKRHEAENIGGANIIEWENHFKLPRDSLRFFEQACQSLRVHACVRACLRSRPLRCEGS